MRPLLAALLLAAACTSTPSEKAAPPAAGTTDKLASDVKALGEDVNHLAQRVTEEIKNGSAGAERSVRDRTDELTRRASELQETVQQQMQSGMDHVTETTRVSLQRTKQQLESLGRELDRQVGQGGSGGP